MSAANSKNINELNRRNDVFKRHSCSHFIVTLLYIIFVLSVRKYNIGKLFSFFSYPVFGIIALKIPLNIIYKRVLPVLPVVIIIGAFNPLFDSNRVIIFDTIVSAGWFSFFSIILKCILTVSAGLILVSAVGINGISYALRCFRFPSVITSQLSFTYRYIHLLSEEVTHILTAHKLRAPHKKNVDIKNFGAMCGGLFLRSLKRADDIHSAMLLRGFSGDIPTIRKENFNFNDVIYIFCWLATFTTLYLV